MGNDAGFDMVPRLKKSEQCNWDIFLEEIQAKYKNDPVFVKKTDFARPRFEFEVGEHPFLILDAQKFCRFSSKWTGVCFPVMAYLRDVHKIAQKHFGKRAKFWNDGAEVGHYDWNEVFKIQYGRGETDTKPAN